MSLDVNIDMCRVSHLLVQLGRVDFDLNDPSYSIGMGRLPLLLLDGSWNQSHFSKNIISKMLLLIEIWEGSLKLLLSAHYHLAWLNQADSGKLKLMST